MDSMTNVSSLSTLVLLFQTTLPQYMAMIFRSFLCFLSCLFSVIDVLPVLGVVDALLVLVVVDVVRSFCVDDALPVLSVVEMLPVLTIVPVSYPAVSASGPLNQSVPVVL